jgi:FdhD protein
VVDMVAVEEPLNIRVSHSVKDARHTADLALTMRTPGDDEELAAGYLLSEGVITSREQIVGIFPAGIAPSNEVLVELQPGVDLDSWRLARLSFLSSSCGVCGKRSREALDPPEQTLANQEITFDSTVISRLPELLRDQQQGFAQTGGLHAAALVNVAGQMVQAFEDIGRHNALDKLLGWCLLRDMLPLSGYALFLSSRSSFELVQKAIAAGAPVLGTVGSPSSLAIETARDFGLTLIGFVRGDRMNVYSGEWRIHSQ